MPVVDTSSLAKTQTVQRLPRPDRKFNLIIYRIKESPKGTQCHIHSSHDIEVATSILSSVASSISEYVWDCSRLDKYSVDTMNGPNDIVSVLANKRQLSPFPGISIKPDLPPEDRKVESILLKQRRAFIVAGTDAQSIRLRKNSLTVNGKKFDAVINSTLSLAHHYLKPQILDHP